MRSSACLLSLSALFFVAPVVSAATKGQVDLEIAGGTQPGAALSFQEWSRALTAAGVKQRFSLRGGQAGDKPAIETGGTEQLPFYKVTAVLTQGDVLVVPGARFRRTECKQLAQWLDDLARLGPPEKRERIVAFGLTASQLKKVRADLAKTVDFSTKGMSRTDAVNKIAAQLELKLAVDGHLSDADSDDDKIAEELSGLSIGTALACILRPPGFCMVPREADDTLGYTVKKAELGKEVWPIGWPAENTQKILPGIYEFHNVNVSGVAATKVLAAVGKQLGVPVLYDHNAMAFHGVDLAKAVVSYPQKRTNYSIALRAMLAKVGLKFEVRIDEAGKPFLWVTTMKPV